MNPKGKAALGYVTRLRWSVFAVLSDGKTPLVDKDLEIEHGYKDASSDPEVISTIWTCYPDANLALACGLVSGGILVFDVDNKPAGEGKPGVDGFASLKRLEAKYGPLPRTWRAGTPSGGEHRYFRQPDRPLRNKVGLTVALNDGEREKYAGLDIRTDGGSVCVPPSVRPDGAYQWLDHPLKTPLAELPGWLLAIIDPPEPPRSPAAPVRFESTDRMVRYVETVVNDECRELAQMGPNTGRNLKLFQASANLFSLVGGNVLPEDIASSALERAATECGLAQEDGWHAVRATIASGKRAGLANPREVRL